MKPGPKRTPAITRFWKKVSFKSNDCWQWTGAVGAGDQTGGYGQFRDAGKTVYAHRFSYGMFGGEIPDGLHLDHLCRNRLCVNPLHLEPVTCRENLLRGVGMSAVNAKKTHCSHGHAYTEENIYWRKNGARRCKTCVNAQNARSANKNKLNDIGGLNAVKL